MKKRRALLPLAFLLGLLTPAVPVHAQKAVLLVRHAEKTSSKTDPLLTKAGEKRARRLAEIVKDAGVTAIYTSEFQRTIQTAAPAAKALGITPEAVPGKDYDALLGKIKALSPDDVALVVGHSNTVPAILKGLGSTLEITIADGDFGNLFVVVPRAGGPPAVVRLRY